MYRCTILLPRTCESYLLLDVDVRGHLHVSELSCRAQRHVRFDRRRARLTVENVRDAGARIVIHHPCSVDVGASTSGLSRISCTFLIADGEELVRRSLAEMMLLVASLAHIQL